MGRIMTKQNELDGLRVHFFVSRNKDNRNVFGFHKRTKAFLAEGNSEAIYETFLDFVNHGVRGEMCRHYVSVNPRSPEKIRESLIVRLVTLKPDVTQMDSLTASLAARPECALAKQWLLDFDSRDEVLLGEFLTELPFSDDELKVFDTPHGYAVVTPHGFDTRGLEKYPFTNKRDGSLILEWLRNG